MSTTGVECSDDVPGTGVRNSSSLEVFLELSHGNQEYTHTIT